MRVSSSNFRLPLESRRRAQATIRSTLLMLVLFLVGMAVGALWVYRSTHKPGTTGNDVGRTMADSTRAVLKSLNSPVEIQFYSLLTEGRSSGDLREFAERVTQLL